MRSWTLIVSNLPKLINFSTCLKKSCLFWAEPQSAMGTRCLRTAFTNAQTYIYTLSGINTGLSIASSSGGGNQTCSSTLVLFCMYTSEILGVGNPCAPHSLNKSQTLISFSTGASVPPQLLHCSSSLELLHNLSI